MVSVGADFFDLAFAAGRVVWAEDEVFRVPWDLEPGTVLRLFCMEVFFGLERCFLDFRILTPLPHRRQPADWRLGAKLL